MILAGISTKLKSCVIYVCESCIVCWCKMMIGNVSVKSKDIRGLLVLGCMTCIGKCNIISDI